MATYIFPPPSRRYVVIAIKVPILLLIAGFSAFLIYNGDPNPIHAMMFSGANRRATAQHFKVNQEIYQQILSEVKKDFTRFDASKYEKLFPEGFEVVGSPLVIEVMPIDFYYVLVYSERRPALNNATDYSAIIEDFGNNWYLVERDWN